MTSSSQSNDRHFQMMLPPQHQFVGDWTWDEGFPNYRQAEYE